MDQYFHGNVVSPHIRHRTELHKKWTQHLVSLLKMRFKIPCRPKCKISASVFNHVRSLHVWRGLFKSLILPCSNIQWCLSLSLSGLAPCRLTETPSTADYGVSCCLQPVFSTTFMSPMLSLQQHQHVNRLGGKERQHCPTPSPSQLCSRKSDIAQSSISRLRF